MGVTLATISGFSMAILVCQILGWIIHLGTPDARYKTGYRGNVSGSDWAGGPYHFFIWVLSVVGMVFSYGGVGVLVTLGVAVILFIPVVILGLVLKTIERFGPWADVNAANEWEFRDRWKWLEWIA